MGYYGGIEVAVNNVTNTEISYLEGVTGSIQTQLNAKQDSLTFGIADTNAVKIDGSNVISTDYARFTENGLEGLSISEVKTDLNLENVTNESKSTMFTNPTLTGNITMSGPLDYSGHLLPNSNAVYDIGSAAYKVRHLFLSDNGIYLLLFY